MRWPSIEAIAAFTPLPAGYRVASLGRADIGALIAALPAWHPSIAAGGHRCYLREDFYLDRVCLDDGVDRDIIVLRILHAEQPVGFFSLEREVDSLAIWGRVVVLAPGHRGAKVYRHISAGGEALARIMGAAFLYAFAPLDTPAVQRSLELAGCRLLGFLPGRDREEVAPGVVKRVYQAVYAKLLVQESQIHWPDSAKMTPRARELYGLLFPEHRATPPPA